MGPVGECSLLDTQSSFPPLLSSQSDRASHSATSIPACYGDQERWAHMATVTGSFPQETPGLGPRPPRVRLVGWEITMKELTQGSLIMPHLYSPITMYRTLSRRPRPSNSPIECGCTNLLPFFRTGPFVSQARNPTGFGAGLDAGLYVYQY